MDPKQALIQGIIIPAVITLFFVVVSWRPWKRDGAATGAWGSALGIAIGYAAADFIIRGWHGSLLGIFPKAGSNYHPYVALCAGILIAALTFWKKIGARLPVSILLTSGACLLYYRSFLFGDLQGTLPVLGISVAAGLLMWLCVWTPAFKARGARIPLMLWAAAVGNALILAQSGVASLAQMSGALAAAMGVFVLLGWIRPGIPAVTGALPVYTLVMLGLLIHARDFGPLKKTDFALMVAALAVCSPALTLLPPMKKLKPWACTAVGLALTCVVCAVGLWLTPDGFDFSGFK